MWKFLRKSILFLVCLFSVVLLPLHSASAYEFNGNSGVAGISTSSQLCTDGVCVNATRLSNNSAQFYQSSSTVLTNPITAIFVRVYSGVPANSIATLSFKMVGDWRSRFVGFSSNAQFTILQTDYGVFDNNTYITVTVYVRQGTTTFNLQPDGGSMIFDYGSSSNVLQFMINPISWAELSTPITDSSLNGIRSSLENIYSSNYTQEGLLQSLNNKIDELNNKSDENTQAVKDVNNSINNSDTSAASSDGASFFNGFSTDTSGLTSIITAPLNLIKNITSSSCSAVALPLPQWFGGSNLNLPCLRSIYEENFGALYEIYKIITFGIIAYWVCVRVMAMVKGFKDPEDDGVEVLEL